MIDGIGALRRIKLSPTLAITARAAALRREGHTIVGLSAGEPDFDTPAHIIEAAVAALRSGQTRYTAVDGTPELKAAIQHKFRRDNGIEFSTDEIIVNVGAKHAIMQALLAMLGTGDEAVFQAPYWVSYPDMVLLAGGTPVVVPTSESNGFKMTPANLAAAITPRTRVVILNSPSNPAGAVYRASELKGLADVLLAHPNVWALCDDIYEHIVFDGIRFTTLVQVEPRLRERTITVNGASKAYSMTGFRIGYAAGPANLIRGMGTLQSHSTSNPCSIAQAAAVAALTGPQEFLAQRANVFAGRRDRVLAQLEAIPGICCAKPEGAFYLYPNCEGLLGLCTPEGVRLRSDRDVVEYLLVAGGVATVHGSAFGLAPYFRISYATSNDALDDACARMRAAVCRLT
jgi:aspartate aminotransferase